MSKVNLVNILDSLLLLSKSSKSKFYVLNKNKDEYLIKHKEKETYTIRRFPKGKASKKKLDTDVPKEFFKTLEIEEVHIINDIFNKDSILCIYKK